MPLPTERISLRKTDNAIIRIGLDRIVNGFAEWRLNKRLSADLVDPQLKTKLQPRFLAEGTYETFLSLRQRLSSVAQQVRSKHRLTVTEFAMIAFAVRIARKFAQVKNTEKLQRRLEVFRKRAKRETISRKGVLAYKCEAHKWLCSSRWIRFNILPLPSRRFSFGELSLYRQQRESMLRLAMEVLAERCTVIPDGKMVSKFVDLAINEIRHHRHWGIKVRELIADSARGKRFLFDFVRKRMERRETDLQLRFEYQPRCVQAAIRGERFAAALVAQSPAPPVEPLLSEVTRSPQTGPRLQPQSAVSSGGPTLHPVLTPQLVSDWLLKEVEREFWDDVIAEAKYQLDRRKTGPSALFGVADVGALQKACRPAHDGSDTPEYVNGRVDWLLGWTLALEMESTRVRQVLGEGLREAKSHHQSLDNRLLIMDGVRYIQGISDGTQRS